MAASAIIAFIVASVLVGCTIGCYGDSPSGVSSVVSSGVSSGVTSGVTSGVDAYNRGYVSKHSQLRTVLIVLLARNKAHTLPHFLAMLDGLDYPKDKLRLWIRSDHNRDATAALLRMWLADVADEYDSVNVDIDDEIYRIGGGSPTEWTPERYARVIRLKEEALNAARNDDGVDLVWFLDGDAFVADPATLKHLLEKGHPISAPLLTSTGPYSNFWAGMSPSHYYLRTPEYVPILERKRDKRGCFAVPMVHSSVLVDLGAEGAADLTFDPAKLKGWSGVPEDDIIAFALSAKSAGVPMHVCNEEKFGYIMTPLEAGEDLADDYVRLSDLRLQMIADRGPVPIRDDMERERVQWQGNTGMLGADRVYLINLGRRPDRRLKMEECFRELGVEYKYVEAVDGKDMTDDSVRRDGLRVLPGYVEPYSKRETLTFGEIGCFLSHHKIWQEMMERGYERIIVFEDDIRFEPDFLDNMDGLYEELDRLKLDWDLVYLGRKILDNVHEPFVNGSEFLLRPDYTYWTLSYLLSRSGAKKLLDAEPLTKLVPVDEFVPIMFDRHPNKTWKSHFANRDLKAFAVQPVFVHPTHYTSDDGYFTDTEWADRHDEL